MKSLGVKHVVSSAYHPEFQGALERWHKTPKSMLQKYCLEKDRNWEEGVPLMLFVMREAKQESLGFRIADLVFGHAVRGPLKLLKEELFASTLSDEVNVLNYVSAFK